MLRKNRQDFKGFALIVAIVLLLNMFAGCNATVSDPVVAKIGDLNISYSTYYSVYMQYKSLYSQFGMYDVSTKDKLRNFQDIVFDVIIDNNVPINQALKAGVTLNEDEEALAQQDFAEQFDELLEQFHEDIDPSITDEMEIRDEAIRLLREALKSNNRDYNDYLNNMLEECRNVRITDKYVSELLSVVEVNDQDVQDYYDEQLESQRAEYEEDPAAYYSAYSNWAQYGTSNGYSRPLVAPEGYYTFKHILVQFIEDDTDNEQLYEIIAEIQQKIADGVDFETLIADYNEDGGMDSEPYKTEGYILGEANRDSYYEEFSEAALALENIGDISEPVESEAGVHIIMKTGEVSTEATPFEDVKDEMETNLFNTLQNTLYDEYLTQWKEDTKVTLYHSRVQAVQ